jgi:hypothetical protein
MSDASIDHIKPNPAGAQESSNSLHRGCLITHLPDLSMHRTAFQHDTIPIAHSRQSYGTPLEAPNTIVIRTTNGVGICQARRGETQ